MHGRLIRLALPAAMLPLIGACAAQGPFPSLAPRAVERDLAGGSAPAGCPDFPEAEPSASAPTPPIVNPDPRLGARAADFAEALPAARAAAESAGAVGTEGWIAAQQEISRLEAARARTVDALAELDALAISRSGVPVGEADYQAVLAAAEEVRGLVQAQQAELDRIQGLVRNP